MLRKGRYEEGQRLRRLIELLFKIQAHPGIKSKRLSEELEVSERQIYRDLNHLELAGVPFDRSQGYRFMQESYLKPFRFGWGELLSIYLASTALTSTKNFFLAQNMRMVLEKIEIQLDEEMRKKLEQVRDRILMDVSEFEEIDIREGIFNIINQSIISQRGLNIKYHTMGMEKLTKREIDPYALIYRAGAWYLIAYCHLRKELRTFRVNRIRDVALTERHFDIPKEFSIKGKFDRVLRVRGGEETRVKVRFDSEVARFIKEVKWLPQQTIKANPNGSIILSGIVSGTEEFKYWVLSWGQFAEVLSPPALRHDVKQTTLQMAKKYK